MYKFTVPKEKEVRVIINTDAKNEADDQFAIVHALLTPKFDIRGIIGAHFGQHRTKTSMQESYDECVKVLDIMDLTGKYKVYRGAKLAVKSTKDYEYSEGAKLIVEEALSSDKRPLFVIFLGPITDLACAYLANPEIAGKLKAIWIGGGKYPSGNWEFNLWNDINGANVVMKSDIELWQVPSNVYSRMLVSLAELEDKIRPYGKIGEYLFQQMIDFNILLKDVEHFPKGESWSLGDSPAVGLMMDSMDYAWEMEEAPIIDDEMNYHFDGKGRQIRVYKDINERFILEDLFSKIKINYQNKIHP